MMKRRLSGWQMLMAATVILGAGAGAVGIAVGSDHQDTPEVELNAKMDMTDVYAFPGTGTDRIVLVMNSRAFLTPGQTAGATFDADLLYQFKIDNTGDAVEDKVIQVTFRNTSGAQQVDVRGVIDPPVKGAMMNTVADVTPAVSGAINTSLGDPSGIQVFAGPRDDPFFIDLEAAFCILADRKPVTGPLAGPCTLTANPNPPFFFRNPGVNYVGGANPFNVLSIVIELPEASLTAGGSSRISVWGTISR